MGIIYYYGETACGNDTSGIHTPMYTKITVDPSTPVVAGQQMDFVNGYKIHS